MVMSNMEPPATDIVAIAPSLIAVGFQIPLFIFEILRIIVNCCSKPKVENALMTSPMTEVLNTSNENSNSTSSSFSSSSSSEYSSRFRRFDEELVDSRKEKETVRFNNAHYSQQLPKKNRYAPNLFSNSDTDLDDDDEDLPLPSARTSKAVFSEDHLRFPIMKSTTSHDDVGNFGASGRKDILSPSVVRFQPLYTTPSKSHHSFKTDHPRNNEIIFDSKINRLIYEQHSTSQPHVASKEKINHQVNGYNSTSTGAKRTVRFDDSNKGISVENVQDWNMLIRKTSVPTQPIRDQRQKQIIRAPVTAPSKRKISTSIQTNSNKMVPVVLETVV